MSSLSEFLPRSTEGRKCRQRGSVDFANSTRKVLQTDEQRVLLQTGRLFNQR